MNEFELRGCHDNRRKLQKKTNYLVKNIKSSDLTF